MKGALCIYIVGIGLLVPSILLAVGGITHLKNGIAVDSAFPVPLTLSTDTVVPRVAYRDAVDSLEYSNIHDGAAQVALAESRFRAGENGSKIKDAVVNGLRAAPSIAEGLSPFMRKYLRARIPPMPPKVCAFAQSITLDPYGYFWTARRAIVASRLWDYLDSDSRAAALREVHVLWDDPGLRDNLLVLVAEPDGARLVTRAYVSDTTALRTLNRWISARGRELQLGPSR